jgi:hypothetical protein
MAEKESEAGSVEEVDPTGFSKEDKHVALAGNVKDYKAQMKTASLIEEALILIRSAARTNDYFVGYSLTEVIEDKLAVIGGEPPKTGKADDVVDQFKPGSASNPKERTQIAQINYLWELLLGEDEAGSLEKGGALGRAINAKDLKDLTWPEDDDAGDGAGI